VRVLNGTTTNGLAADVTTSLQAQGYKAVLSTKLPSHTAVTTIVYGTSRQESYAKQLAAQFPGAKVEGGGYGTQVVLTLGDDYAAAVNVKTQVTSAPPRWRNLRRPPIVFIHPKPCSTNFRFF